MSMVAWRSPKPLVGVRIPLALQFVLTKNIPYQTLLSLLIQDFAEGDYTLKI